MDSLVKYKSGGRITTLTFAHAEGLFKQIAKNKGGVIPEIISNHEFINNELIKKPSNRGSKKPNKSKRGNKGKEVPE